MGTTNNPNILFRLSGVLGDYIFQQNPVYMGVMKFKDYENKMDLLVGEDIYMRGLLDNEVRVMRWDKADYSIYTGLAPFAVRNTSGTLDATYFWDGTVNEFRGVPVHVLSAYASPLASELNLYTIEVQIKPIQI